MARLIVRDEKGEVCIDRTILGYETVGDVKDQIIRHLSQKNVSDSLRTIGCISNISHEIESNQNDRICRFYENIAHLHNKFGDSCDQNFSSDNEAKTKGISDLNIKKHEILSLLDDQNIENPFQYVLRCPGDLFTEKSINKNNPKYENGNVLRVNKNHEEKFIEKSSLVTSKLLLNLCEWQDLFKEALKREDQCSFLEENDTVPSKSKEQQPSCRYLDTKGIISAKNSLNYIPKSQSNDSNYYNACFDEKDSFGCKRHPLSFYNSFKQFQEPQTNDFYFYDDFFNERNSFDCKQHLLSFYDPYKLFQRTKSILSLDLDISEKNYSLLYKHFTTNLVINRKNFIFKNTKNASYMFQDFLKVENDSSLNFNKNKDLSKKFGNTNIFHHEKRKRCINVQKNWFLKYLLCINLCFNQENSIIVQAEKSGYFSKERKNKSQNSKDLSFNDKTSKEKIINIYEVDSRRNDRQNHDNVFIFEDKPFLTEKSCLPIEIRNIIPEKQTVKSNQNFETKKAQLDQKLFSFQTFKKNNSLEYIGGSNQFQNSSKIKILLNGKIINEKIQLKDLKNENGLELVYFVFQTKNFSNPKMNKEISKDEIIKIENYDDFQSIIGSNHKSVVESKSNKNSSASSQKASELSNSFEKISKYSEKESKIDSFEFLDQNLLSKNLRSNQSLLIRKDISKNDNPCINKIKLPPSTKEMINHLQNQNVEGTNETENGDRDDLISTNSIEDSMKVKINIRGRKMSVDPDQIYSYKNKIYLISKRKKVKNMISSFRQSISQIQISLVIKISAIIALFITGNKSFSLILITLALLKYISKINFKLSMASKNSIEFITKTFLAFFLTMFFINSDSIMVFPKLIKNKKTV